MHRVMELEPVVSEFLAVEFLVAVPGPQVFLRGFAGLFCLKLSANNLVLNFRSSCFCGLLQGNV